MSEQVDSINMHRFFYALTFFCFSLAAAIPLQSLDLTLNNQCHGVLERSILRALARPSEEIDGLPAIPLSCLYPWMNTIDSLEIISESGHSIRYAAKPGETLQGDAFLVLHNGIWEVRIGSDIIIHPIKIAVNGNPFPLPHKKIEIWRTFSDSLFYKDLESAFALRGVEVQWRDIEGCSNLNPINLLGDAPAEGLPDLVFLEGSYFPQTVDVRDSDAVFSVLQAEDENLCGFDGRPEKHLALLFEHAMNLNYSELPTEQNLLLAFVSDESQSAFMTLPNAADNTAPLNSEKLIRIETPEGYADITHQSYAAVPAGVRNEELSRLLLNDIVKCLIGDASEDASLPTRLSRFRFNEAYARIGRLVFSGQMGSEEAASIIMRYITTEQ